MQHSFLGMTSHSEQRGLLKIVTCRKLHTKKESELCELLRKVVHTMRYEI